MDEKIDSKDEVSIIGGIKTKWRQLSTLTKIKWLAVVLVVVVVIIVFGNFSTSTNTINNSANILEYDSTYYVSSLDYSAKLEDKLQKVLSNIDGVGHVEVMITLDSSIELVLAESSKGQNSGSLVGDSYAVEVTSPIIIDKGDREEPLIIKEILPNVKGVLVVLSGDNSVTTRLNIIQAVQSLLDISASKIQVLSGS